MTPQETTRQHKKKRKFSEIVSQESSDCSRGTRYGERWFKNGYCYKALFPPGEEVELGAWPTASLLISIGAPDGPLTIVEDGKYHVDVEGTFSLHEIPETSLIGGKLESIAEITQMRLQNKYFRLRYRDLSLGEDRFYTKRKREKRINKFSGKNREVKSRERKFLPSKLAVKRERKFEPVEIIYKHIPAFAEETCEIYIPILFRKSVMGIKERKRDFVPLDSVERFLYARRRLLALKKSLFKYTETKDFKSLVDMIRFVQSAGPSAKGTLWVTLLSRAIKNNNEAKLAVAAKEAEAEKARHKARLKVLKASNVTSFQKPKWKNPLGKFHF